MTADQFKQFKALRAAGGDHRQGGLDGACGERRGDEVMLWHPAEGRRNGG